MTELVRPFAPLWALLKPATTVDVFHMADAWTGVLVTERFVNAVAGLGLDGVTRSAIRHEPSNDLGTFAGIPDIAWDSERCRQPVRALSE